MRIAVAQMIQETHSFNPNPTDLSHFERAGGSNHADVYRCFGLEPAEAKMKAVKMIGHFESFRPMIKELIFADCPGWSGDLR